MQVMKRQYPPATTMKNLMTNQETAHERRVSISLMVSVVPQSEVE